MPYNLSGKKDNGAGIMVAVRSKKVRTGRKLVVRRRKMRPHEEVAEELAILSERWLRRKLLGGREGRVNIERTVELFGMSRAKLAETVGVKPDTLQRSSRASSPTTQARLGEMLEIISRVEDWAGGAQQAMAWYRAEPLPEFGGRTAESLVKEGKATAVRDYLDHVALGGFA
jgi:uncharacterized protein (DUF2384 family)